jgi:hypothetical protein
MKEEYITYRALLYDIPAGVIVTANVTIYFLAARKIRQMRSSGNQ